MTREQWRVVEHLFAELSELDAGEQAARLDGILDVEVRRELASLLPHAGTGETMNTAIIDLAAETKTVPVMDQRFGPWRAVRRLGQGGQGAVYEGVRDDGSFHQRVAIKILNWAIDTEDARARFRQERQILAALEHPNIARLLDGGQRDDGAPYLVMEFIEGRPLTTATRGWPVERKVEIFLQVLSAVAFAHRKRVIHRDLKPANILVTEEGIPKLLDFGIAKFLDSDATRTLTGMQALTPQYASPEQVRGDTLTVASDVYSLGVVLYELLTDRRPYQIHSTSPVMVERAVCHTSPEPPGISRDLDSILLMALRKEPERRYVTAEEFAEDLKRSQSNLPIRARPDRLSYRAAKFVRRHNTGLLAGASLLIAAVVLLLAVTGQLRGPAPEKALSLRQLTASTAMDLWPSFSPDGREIAFASNRTGRFQIYRRSIAAEGVDERLHAGSEDLIEPAWSPDAKYLAAASPAGIELIPLSGGTAMRLTESGNRPQWSPDGRSLVYTSGAAKPVTETLNLHPTAVMIASLDGSAPRPLTRPGTPPGSPDLADWLPDGRHVVFSAVTATGVRAWVMDIQSGLLQPIDVPVVDARNPTVSPDRRHLYFAGSSAAPGLFRARLESARFESAWKAGTPEKVASGFARDLAISADGAHLAVSLQSGVDGIWSVGLNAAGMSAGPPHPLVVDRSVRNLAPNFSADGSAILYSSLREGGNYRVFAANPDGSGAHPIRMGGHADPEAQWIGRGLTLGYVLYSESGHRSYWVAPPGGLPSRLSLKLDLDKAGRLRMSPDRSRIAANMTSGTGHHIAVENLATGEIRDVTPPGRNITYAFWSRDSRWLAADEQVADRSNLVVFPAAGGEVQTLVDNFTEAWASDWAPDNDRVVFAGLRNGVWNVYWVSKSTRRIEQLTHFDLQSAFVRYPSWSPRNNQVVFERDEVTANIYVADLQ